MTNVKDAGREGGGLNIWAEKFQKCSKWLEKDFETWFFFVTKGSPDPPPFCDIRHKKSGFFFEGSPYQSMKP